MPTGLDIVGRVSLLLGLLSERSRSGLRSSFDRLWPLAAVVFAAVVVNIPYFLPKYYPVHDTLSVFHIFSYYYSELLFQNELPWWLPMTAYGMPIDSHILFSFGPFQYLSMFVGWIFRVEHTLFLFSASLVADTLFLALTSFLFARHIYRDRLTAVICVVSLLILIQYDRQVYWNFKILIAVPLALYLVQRAIEAFNPIYILLVILDLLAWTFGSVSYVLPFQFYLVVFYAIALVALKFARGEMSIGNVRSSLNEQYARLARPGVAISLCGVALAISVLVFMLYVFRGEMQANMAYNAIGRGGGFGVSINDYLTYGGNTGPEKLMEILNGLPTSHPHDFLAYIGLVNGCLVALGVLLVQRSSSQIALALIAFFAIAFCVTATHVAEAMYVLPGMSFIRHIGYFIPIGKLLLIFLTGFGIQACMRRFGWLEFCVVMTVVAVCVMTTTFSSDNLYSMHAAFVAAAIVVLFATFRFIPQYRGALVLGVVVIMLLDAGSYRLLIYKMADLFLVQFPKEFVTAQPLQYRSTRVRDEDAPVLKRYRLKPMDIYGGSDGYLGEDFCKGSRQDLISPGVKALFDSRLPNRTAVNDPRKFLDPRQDGVLAKVLGCDVPKLRLVARVKYVNDSEAAARIACCSSDIYDAPVIVADKVTDRTCDPPGTSPSPSIIDVVDFASNRMTLRVHNVSRDPEWLIYADGFDARWSATIDGVPSPIFPANIAFKAVQIPAGEHVVQFVFLHRCIWAFWLFVGVMMAAGVGAVCFAGWWILNGDDVSGRQRTSG